MKKNSDVVLLIPAFNEQSRIAKVVKSCRKFFSFILVVDDGSKDKTFQEAVDAKANKVIRHCINCGQGTALKTGINYFLSLKNKKYLITFDADGQHLVEDALRMLDYSQLKGADAVLGSRFLNKNKNLGINFGRKLVLQLARIFEKVFFNINLTDSHNGLRVLSKKSCKKLFNIKSSSMAHATEISSILTKSNLKIYEYPCKILYGVNNKKSQSIINSINIISDLLQNK